MEDSMHIGEQETSLQDQSYHTIRRKIVYLDYKPGEKLGVKQLCDDLDMGRTPVREALVRLAQEGLVRTVPQSGTYVSPINLTLAESACYIREHLEKQVIVECCARATSAGVEQLDRARRLPAGRGRRAPGRLRCRHRERLRALHQDPARPPRHRLLICFGRLSGRGVRNDSGAPRSLFMRSLQAPSASV